MRSETTRVSDFSRFSHGAWTGVCAGPGAKDIAEWIESDKKGRVIKDNAVRTVWVWERPGRDAIVIKKYKAGGFWDRVRTRLFGSRAAKELKLLASMAASGIPVPAPVAAFMDAEGSGYLATSFIPNARTLKEYFAAGWDRRADKDRMLVDLGAFVHRLHERGVYNRDLHIGNILVQDAPFRFFLIDVQRGSIHKHLPMEWCLRAVAFTLHSFYTFVNLHDGHRFLTAYFQGYQHPEGLMRRVWELFHDIRTGYYRSRDRHVLTSRRTTERVKRTDGTVITMLSGINTEDIMSVAGNPQALRCVKSLPGRALYLDGSGRYVKVIQYAGLGKKLENWIKRPPAFRIWYHTQALKNRGIDTPECFAALESPGQGVVVGAWLPEARPLNEYVDREVRPMRRREKSDFIRSLARYVRKVHGRGIFHRDMKANNILLNVGKPVKFYLIDLDRVRIAPSSELGSMTPERMMNLAQLNAAIGTGVTRADRLRFYKDYVGRRQAVWAGRKKIISKIMDLTRSRRHVWP